MRKALKIAACSYMALMTIFLTYGIAYLQADPLLMALAIPCTLFVLAANPFKS